MEKLFLITRRDLPPGQQAVQAVHAGIEFMVRHPAEAVSWYETSNTLAFLEVGDEDELLALLHRASEAGFEAPGFREPDRGDELTAIAIGPRGRRVCRGLELALKEDPGGP